MITGTIWSPGHSTILTVDVKGWNVWCGSYYQLTIAVCATRGITHLYHIKKQQLQGGKNWMWKYTEAF